MADTEPTAEANPPIIISGGSLRISSRVELKPRREGGRYIYETSDFKIRRIKTQGKNKQEDDTDNGAFTIQLFD